MFVTDKVKEDLDEEDIILVEATGTMIWDQEGTRGEGRSPWSDALFCRFKHWKNFVIVSASNLC